MRVMCSVSCSGTVGIPRNHLTDELNTLHCQHWHLRTWYRPRRGIVKLFPGTQVGVHFLTPVHLDALLVCRRRGAAFVGMFPFAAPAAPYTCHFVPAALAALLSCALFFSPAAPLVPDLSWLTCPGVCAAAKAKKNVNFKKSGAACAVRTHCGVRCAGAPPQDRCAATENRWPCTGMHPGGGSSCPPGY
eukprot:gene15520-biopygen15741